MANEPITLLLNEGLDQATPAIVSKPGALTDALNYEMTGDFGYKRIDGFERFDGYPNGSFSGTFYHVTLAPVDPGTDDLISVGNTLSREAETTVGATPVGGVVTNQVGIIVEEIDEDNFIYLAYDEGGALKAGETIYWTNVVSYEATVVSDAVDIRETITDPEVYLTAIRTYQNVLRAAVEETHHNIAGCWWHNDSLYLACDAPVLTFTAEDVGHYVSPGTLLLYGGTVLRVLTPVEFDEGDSPVPGRQKVAVLPRDLNWALSGSGQVVYETDDTGTVKGSIALTGEVSYPGEYAYVVRCNSVENSLERGFQPLAPAFRYPFDAGSYTSETLPTDGWTLRDAAGTKIINVEIDAYTVDTGTFVGGNAVGQVIITNLNGETGGSAIRNDWELWYGGARRMTLNYTSVQGKGPKLAGTKRLRIAGTHYQTVDVNFYGNASWNRTYGVTGASNAFWADEESFGPIIVMNDEAIDQPKYVAHHAGRLALGYAVGSVMRSAIGEPYNWSGLDGAQEIATGDKITGLIEAAGDSLVVLGRRSIRRLDASGTPTTITSDAGAFDYTAVLMGQEIVYTGVSGISTLSQTAAYGDFEGHRASGSVQQWLRPRLLVDNNGFETGGVAMALPVRNKNQYRLFLKNGMVIFLTLTGEGYKAMRVNYGNGDDLRVPAAWSSAVADNGKEHVHVVWDYTLASRGIRGVVGTLPERTFVYELDSGWGFDGEVFPHYFDTTPVFVNSGTQATGIEKVRLFGRGYGIASLSIRAASIIEDFDADFSSRLLDISLPRTPVLLRDELGDFTCLADHANWGMGIKIRIEGKNTVTEPSHICQVLRLHVRTEGAADA